MKELTAARRRRFAAQFLKTLDPELAGKAVGRDDGPALLRSRAVRRELERQRQDWGQCLEPGDITRRMAAIAFGQANDCVRLALDPECDISTLDLTLLSEIRRTDKGMVEIKLADRMGALEYLASVTGGRQDPAAEFLEALAGADAP